MGVDDTTSWSAGPPVSEPLFSVLTESRRRHLIGPASFDAQVMHSAGFAEPLQVGSRVMDLGSGGGLPGLVLAIGRPDLTMVLTDAAQRRVRFLEWAIAEMELGDRVDVLWDRAEDLGRDIELRGDFDAVVARSFGLPAVTAECARPFLKNRGMLVVSEPPLSGSSPPGSSPPGSAVPGPAVSGPQMPGPQPGGPVADEDDSSGDGGRWPRTGLAELGLEAVDAYRFAGSGYQVLEAVDECPERFPRRAGVPARQPLF